MSVKCSEIKNAVLPQRVDLLYKARIEALLSHQKKEQVLAGFFVSYKVG